ncbi:MAG: four helix bundle protein [Chloroflexi bacterium]|nr:four helix bundle protein [Chloroflexota bacterium]
MRPFRDLRVWQDAHSLTLAVYRATEPFPRTEIFGLTSQARRAASSIAANIVEGSVKGPREFRQPLVVALGSATELEYHLLLGRDLGYLDDGRYDELAVLARSVQRMLVTFMKRLSVGADAPRADSRQPRALP